ncbi:MAG: site-specific integrase [Gammaproteobacteria bacterium]
MAQRGRKRSAKQLPNNIQPEKLPTRVWYSKNGSGCWMMDYYDPAAGKNRSKKIAGGAASLSEIWQAFEANQDNKPVTTFRSLSVDFQKTLDWRDLSFSTKSDYLDCHKQIVNTKTGNDETLFGDIPIASWTVGTVRKYRDFRGEESKSRANKELSYISRICSWAYAYEKIKNNPAKGVPKFTIKPRQHYAEESDYKFLLQVAKDSGYWYMPIAMEIAYLCRMRLSEVLDLTDNNSMPAGLLIKRRKGSKDNIVAWNERLSTAWSQAIAKRDAILKKRSQPKSQKGFVFISERTGDVIKSSSLKTAKSRIDGLAKQKAETLGINYTHFTFHDLKRKGITDTTGNKQEASGHRNASMPGRDRQGRPR